MSFQKYVHEEGFFGQEKIVLELDIIAKEVIGGRRINLLFQAPSGHGKTTLAYYFLYYIDPHYPNSLQYYPINGEISLDLAKSFHLIDEAHNIKTPETLYPIMDSEDYLIIIATNEYDKLKEPLRNRCLHFNFVPYSEEALTLMLYNQFRSKGITLSKEWCQDIIPYTRGNPRVARNLATRVGFLIRNREYPSSLSRLHELIFDVLGTNENGFTEYDILYLETLSKIGGKASLSLITSLTNLPKRIILEEIEPFLVMKNRLEITSRGRKVKNDKEEKE